MIDEARTREIEQELRGTIQMQDDIICKLVALNERLKAALAIADYSCSECRFCQHRDCVDTEGYREVCESVMDCVLCPNRCPCSKCESGSMWALDLEKLPNAREIVRGEV